MTKGVVFNPTGNVDTPEVTPDPEKRCVRKNFFDGLKPGVLKPVIDKIFALENIVNPHRYM
jgi:NADPH:quinone reductase-like Zn-dependent oxidoreductase